MTFIINHLPQLYVFICTFYGIYLAAVMLVLKHKAGNRTSAQISKNFINFGTRNLFTWFRSPQDGAEHRLPQHKGVGR